MHCDVYWHFPTHQLYICTKKMPWNAHFLGPSPLHVHARKMLLAISAEKEKSLETYWFQGFFMVAGMGFEPHDLRVMSPTSYRTALLRDILLVPWCRWPGSNRYDALASRDFKSRASACSATPANCLSRLHWLSVSIGYYIIFILSCQPIYENYYSFLFFLSLLSSFLAHFVKKRERRSQIWFWDRLF